MSCNCSTTATGTIIQGLGPVQVSGSGTPTDPYIITEQAGGALKFEVRDSATVNMTLFGSGTTDDPIVISADTASAVTLRGLGDVAPNPLFTQGSVPLWIGTTAGGHFEARTPGTRYTTNATRGNGLYQGEVIKETDTGKRYEWDGSQWVSLDPAVQPTVTLDPSVLQNAGTLDPATDWNSLYTKSGIYRVGGINSNVNAPSSVYNYGTLTVKISGLSTTQEYLEHGTGRGYLWTRSKWQSTNDWTPWLRQWTFREGDALTTRVTTLEQQTVAGSVYNVPGNALQSGFANGQWTNRAVRYGPFVVLVFNLVNSSGGTISVSTNSGNVLLLPTGFRPFMPHDFVATNDSYGGNMAMAMDPDGYLRIRGGTVGNNSRLFGTCTFIAA